MHRSWECIALHQLAHAEGQAQRHRHRQSLGHRHHHQCHRYHDGVQHVAHQLHPVVGRAEVGAVGGKVPPDAPNHYQHGDGVARPRYPVGQRIKLPAQRRLAAPSDTHAVYQRLFHHHVGIGVLAQIVGQRSVGLTLGVVGAQHLGRGAVLQQPAYPHLAAFVQRLVDATALRIVANAHHPRHTVAFDDGRTLLYLVRAIGSVTVEEGAVRRLRRLQLTRQRRLVHRQVRCFQQHAVSRYLLARLQLHRVADDDVHTRHLYQPSVSVHLHQRVVVCLVQTLKRLLVLLLQEVGDARSQYQRHDDARGLEEHRPTGPVPFVLIDGNAHR